MPDSHLGGDSAYTHKKRGSVLTSQMFLLNFIHSNEEKMDTHPITGRLCISWKKLMTEIKTP